MIVINHEHDSRARMTQYITTLTHMLQSGTPVKI
jgi:hypothetical protein